jgi:2-desacetyl-2-hydroxyethyl bacteriochlorophyllide A dehydrogenase
MRAGVLRELNHIEVEELPDPTPGAHEFVLQVEACGICGSDLHSYSVEGWAEPGRVLGHEYAGTVIEVGVSVDAVTVGDRIACNPGYSCYACDRCREGSHSLCVNKRLVEGAYAERILVPDGVQSRAIPNGMSMEAGAFVEPLACGVRAVKRARHRPEDPALVVGLGSIGQSVVHALKAHGVKQIIGMDLSPLRRDAAREAGAQVIDPTESDALTALRELVGGGVHRGYEFADVATVFECSGAANLVDHEITAYVRTGGTVVIVALFEQPVSFDANPLVRKEVTLVGTSGYSDDDWNEAFDMVERGTVDVSRIVTHRMPLADINEAFATQFDRNRSVKVMVVP